MNVETEIEAAQFQEKEYINGIFLAVKYRVNKYSLHAVLGYVDRECF
jgi:hypothetical protein